MSIMNRTLGLSLSAGAVALVLAALPAAGQANASDLDGRWLPFIGCWEAVGAQEDIGLLCFSPAGEGVEVTNYVEGEISSIELLVGDGERRQVSAEGCEGWESLVFSEDGRRAFTTTEFLCGDSEARAGTGVMTFLSTTGWADVRALEIDGEPFAWVQEYKLASLETLREHDIADPASDLGMAVRSARMAASASIDIDDVLEASVSMDDKAVETWVILMGEDLRVDAGDLIALAEAGVSDDLIDAVVAVSNPEEFMVEVGHDVERSDVPAYPVHYRGYMSVAHYWGPQWGPGFWYGYSPYSPFYNAYGYYGGSYRYGYWGYRPGYVVVTPRGDRGGAVYRDGYRRGTDRAGRTARPRGSNPPATESGGASSRGSSDTPRRAKPRRRTSGEVAPQTSGVSSLSARPSARPARIAAPRPSSSRTSRPSTPVRTSRPSTPSRISRPSGPSRASAPRVSRPSRPSGARPSTSRPSATSRPSGARPSRPSGAARRPSGMR